MPGKRVAECMANGFVVSVLLLYQAFRLAGRKANVFVYALYSAWLVSMRNGQSENLYARRREPRRGPACCILSLKPLPAMARRIVAQRAPER